MQEVDFHMNKTALVTGGSHNIGQGIAIVLAEHGYDSACGARPLRRTVAAELEDPAADPLLSGRLRAGDRVTASVSGGRVVLTREEPGSLPA